MTTKRRRDPRGSEQREIQTARVRDVMTEEAARGHMSEGCCHIGRSYDLDQLDGDTVPEEEGEVEEILCE